MSNQVKRIGVLTSGGDAPGMNAAVRAVVRTAASRGVECIGIRRGWSGLINSDFVRMDAGSVSHIIDKGGTILYTARSEEFMSEEGRKKAIGTCKLLGLDGIVAIGGDGTFRGAQALSRQIAESGHNLNVVGIPATIDNDIGCSHYTIGFDTACNTAIECIDKLRDTMQSHERCSVVEVMGRHAGYLALYVGISVGATAVLIPERPVDFERDVVEQLRRARLAGTTHYMVVVAEGAGSAFDIAKRIQEEIGIDPRVTVLGHIQRGGAPSGRDRETASRMGYEAVGALMEGKGNRIIATQNGHIVALDMEEALAMRKEFDMERYDVLEALSNGGRGPDCL
jgi:6-phosphofructokinase 1